MKARRDLFLAGGLILLLVLLTIALAFFQSKKEQLPALSSNSNAPDGARALRLWLQELGYAVDNQPRETFTIPQDTQAVFILQPSLMNNLNKEEWKTLETWQEDGGVLLLASRTIWLDLDNSPLEIDTTSVAENTYPFTPAAPLFRSPPIHQPVNLDVQRLFRYQRADVIPLLTSTNGPAAVEAPVGKGRIFLISDSDFISNAGLKDPGHAALVLNLLSSLEPGSAIWMDEWHHGQRPLANDAMGPWAWLQETPSGRAILFSAAVVFIALLLAGQRFGRPVPLLSEQIRRSPLEHVTALANLNRRAGHHRALLQYYRTSLKRAYGRRYRLDASLPDDLYVAQLARYNPSLDAPALLDLLQRLNRSNPSEAQIVQLSREAAGWISKLEH